MWDLKSHHGKTAVVTENGEKYDYAFLERESDKIAQMIGQRCHIFCLCRNDIGSLAGYIGCLNHRIVPLLLSERIDPVLLDGLIEKYRPEYIWMPKTVREKYSYEEVYSALDYVLVKMNVKDSFSLNDDLALLLTTSGSTGSPKLVRQSYGNISSNMKSIAQYLELNETERPISTLPMNYTYGLSIINSHFYVGASMIMTERSIMQKPFWQLFYDCEATSFGGVPYTYEMLERLKFFDMDLPSLRTMTQAGGKLPPERHKQFAMYAEKNGKRFYVMYGQTEATARMSYLPYQNALKKYGSMGIAIPGGKFALIDSDGKEIHGADLVGELVYEGPNVTLGYAECGADLIKGDERRGVLATGDLAKRDADGYYYIVGRKKRFLKIFGNRVNLDETERLIKNQFQDIDCACAGRDDKMAVYITETEDIDRVRKYISDVTGMNHSAFDVKFIQAIPKNDAGKTLYHQLENCE